MLYQGGRKPRVSQRNARKGGPLHVSVAVRDIKEVEQALTVLAAALPALNTSQIIVQTINFMRVKNDGNKEQILG